MSRRAVGVLVLAFVAQACAPAPRAELGTSTRPSDSSALTVAWSTPSEVQPAAGVADRAGVVFTVDHEGVIALDPRGRVEWESPLDGASVGTPIIIGERVILPFSRVDGSGGCIGLDRRTGNAVWTSESIGTGGVAVARAGPYVICLTRNGLTSAHSPVYGISHWAFAYSDYVDAASVRVADGAEMAVDEAAGVFAFTVRVGHQWVTAVRDIATGRSVRLLDIGTAGSPSAPVVIAPGLLAVAASDPAELCVVNVGTGRVRRIAIPGAARFDPATAPLFVPHLVVAVSRAGAVVAIDLDSGRSRWTAHTFAPVPAAHPVSVADAVIVPTDAGTVGFRLSDGARVQLPARSGRAAATVSEPASTGSRPTGVVVLGRTAPGGWIERWQAR